MPSYRIEFKRAARKALVMIQATHAERIRDSIDALAADPFPVGYRKLVGAEAKYRIRVGDYPVIYGVEKPRTRDSRNPHRSSQRDLPLT